jgi:Protein of unknown function (DUF2842)
LKRFPLFNRRRTCQREGPANFEGLSEVHPDNCLKLKRKIAAKTSLKRRIGLNVAKIAQTRDLRTAMNTRLKKLIGTVLFVIGTVCFYFFVITVAIVRLPGSTIGVHLLFYLIATLIWLFLAGLLVRWMQKPGPNRRA